MRNFSIEEYSNAVYGCVMAWGLIKEEQYEYALSMLEQIIENDIDKEVLSLVVNQMCDAGETYEQLNIPVNNP